MAEQPAKTIQNHTKTKKTKKTKATHPENQQKPLEKQKNTKKHRFQTDGARPGAGSLGRAWPHLSEIYGFFVFFGFSNVFFGFLGGWLWFFWFFWFFQVFLHGLLPWCSEGVCVWVRVCQPLPASGLYGCTTWAKPAIPGKPYTAANRLVQALQNPRGRRAGLINLSPPPGQET